MPPPASLLILQHHHLLLFYFSGGISLAFCVVVVVVILTAFFCCVVLFAFVTSHSHGVFGGINRSSSGKQQHEGHVNCHFALLFPVLDLVLLSLLRSRHRPSNDSWAARGRARPPCIIKQYPVYQGE